MQFLLPATIPHMKIAILGFAGQGQSSFDYWNTSENQITVCDQDETISLPADVQRRLGENYLEGLNEFDLIIRTPSINPRDIVAANANDSQILDKVWSNTNEFFKVCPTKNLIGITGTKGKGTTSTLITKMLEEAGKQVHLGGNIGIPPLELFKNNIQPDDWVVLELANFQLIDLRSSPHIGVCLMVEPEHMDWHEDLEEYISAKQQMFINQDEDDIAIYYADNENSLSVADASMGQLIPYMEKPGAYIDGENIIIAGKTICKTNKLKLLGKHNWQNVCAAVTAVWQVTQDLKAISSVLTTFTGLEHRLELVRELNGIKYYDDSFGTTPETAIVAIEAFDQPKVLILGGSDKGAAYEKLAKTVKYGNVRSVIIIGDTGPAIKQALQTTGFNDIIDGPSTISEIVSLASSQAQEGDVVLLSTGCASFGLFKNYKDRGEQFKQSVQELV